MVQIGVTQKDLTLAFDKLKDQKHISCEIQAKEMPIKDQTKQSKVDNNAESRFLQVSAPCGVDS